MPSDGTKNLIPFDQRSEEEQREIRSKGGIASGEARRRKSDLRYIANLILQSDLTDEDKMKAELQKRGLEPTMGNAMLFVQATKANICGDTEAARFVRDTSGQKPVDGLAIGNLDDKPLEVLDLSKLSDADLQRLVAARRGESADESASGRAK